MAKNKSFKGVKTALLLWIRKVRKVKLDSKSVYNTMYKIEKEGNILEFRFDADLYDIINNNIVEKKLHEDFFKILRKYEGEFYNSSIVRFY